MYSLAIMTVRRGIRVTGSDVATSEHTERLSAEGAKIYKGHSSENVSSVTLVVYTSAVARDNPELAAAQQQGIPTVTRAEYMGALMINYKSRIGVSGSHGKSTTVAMLDAIFTQAMCEPTVLSGADLPYGKPYRLGGDNLLLYEACEYKDAFHSFSPTVAVALNLELDHTDYFDGIKALKTSFVKALAKAKLAVINGDDGNLESVRARLKNRVVTFGQGERVDYKYSIVSFKERGYEVAVYKFGSEIIRFNLNMVGTFNVQNAVAATVTAIEYGINTEVIATAISGFSGIPRRLERVGERYGRAVYYDYAHHPTEIRCTINALKLATHDLVTVVFKPHTYTRTKSLWDDFILALSLADYVIITDIYGAREEPIDGISAERLAASIGSRAIYSADSAVPAVVDLQTHGTVIVMGAGDLERVKRELISH